MTHLPEGTHYGESIEFRVLGVAQPQGSKTLGRRRDGTAYLREATPQAKAWRRTVSVEATVALQVAHWAKAHLCGAVQVEITSYRVRPKGWPRWRKLPTTKPDLDKLVRAIGDALSGLPYQDDAQVTDIVARKRLTTEAVPFTDIVVTEIVQPRRTTICGV